MRLFLAAALLLAGGSCALIRAVTGAFQRPTLAYESWSADRLDAEGVTVTLHYRLENPNDVGLDLRTFAYRIEVEGSPVADGDLPLGLQVGARATTPVALPIRLRWREIPRLAELLLTREDVAYRISGRAGVGTPLGTTELPFDHADRLPLPRLPSIRLEGVTWRQLSVQSLALDLRLRIENRNGFPLPVGALTYGLRLGGGEVLGEGTHPLVAVPPRGHAIVTIPLRLSAQGAVAALSKLVHGADVTLRGLAGFGDLEVPVEAPGRLER